MVAQASLNEIGRCIYFQCAETLRLEKPSKYNILIDLSNEKCATESFETSISIVFHLLCAVCEKMQVVRPKIKTDRLLVYYDSMILIMERLVVEA
jgi:hypothetical protein